MLHDIIIQNQAICTKSAFWRLALGTFRNALSRMSTSKLRLSSSKRITDMNYQPRGISDRAIQGPASYLSELGTAEALLKTQPTWDGVTAEAVARMRLQNRFKTGLDIARYTAALMRSDMAAYDADP